MAKLSIVVKTNEQTKTIRVEGLPEDTVVNLIKETIGFANSIPAEIKISNAAKDFIENIKKPEKTVEGEKTTIGKLVTHHVERKVEEKKESAPVYTMGNLDLPKPFSESRPKTLPLLGSENRSTFSLGESFKVQLPNTKRSNDDKLLLRTYVKCPNCGDEHQKRFQPATNTFLKCYGCEEKLAVEPVTNQTQQFEGEEIPVMGPDGFYLMAKKLLN